MFPSVRPPTDQQQLQEHPQASLIRERGAQALRVVERFCTYRSRNKPVEMASMFHRNGSLVTLNNVVHGEAAIYAALEDGQRHSHLMRWFKPWAVCLNTLDDDGSNPAAPVTLERDGRIFTGMWFYDPRFIYVRETCVVVDDKIKLFSTQRKF